MYFLICTYRAVTRSSELGTTHISTPLARLCPFYMTAYIPTLRDPKIETNRTLQNRDQVLIPTFINIHPWISTAWLGPQRSGAYQCGGNVRLGLRV